MDVETRVIVQRSCIVHPRNQQHHGDQNQDLLNGEFNGGCHAQYQDGDFNDLEKKLFKFNNGIDANVEFIEKKRLPAQ